MVRNVSRRELFRWGAGGLLGIGAAGSLPGCGRDPSGARGPLSADPAGGSSTVHATLFPRLGDLYEAAREAARALGITRGALLGGTVFIKPNFVGLGILDGFYPESGECTKPEVAAAVAEQCLEAGAARVVIGDGAQGISWPWERLSFLPGNTVHGAANLASAVSWLNGAFGDRVELVCLNAADRWRTVPSSSADPLLRDGLRIAESFHQADHVISIPCLKSHQWAGLTVSMKNLLGVTPLQGYQIMGEPSRGALHAAYARTAVAGVEDAGVAGAYLDVLRWRRAERKEDFAILDGSIGLEGNGPHAWGDTPFRALPGAGGLTVDLSRRTRSGRYFLLSSRDYVALDTMAAAIARYDWRSMKQLVLAHNLALGNTQGIALRGATLDELTVTAWKPAEQLEDWGAAPAAHAAFPGSTPAGSNLLNHLLPLVCPTACALLWRLWNTRTRVPITDRVRSGHPVPGHRPPDCPPLSGPSGNVRSRKRQAGPFSRRCSCNGSRRQTSEGAGWFAGGERLPPVSGPRPGCSRCSGPSFPPAGR